jgi:2'-phosphotransferase
MQDVSKALAYILRHGTENLLDGGYILLEDILNLPRFRGLSEEDIGRVVLNDTKGRFSLRKSDGNLWIRANQGHSVPVNLNLTPYHPKMAAHGTTMRNWQLIKIRGLSRMGRNHIHFYEKMTGFRASSTIAILINVEKAIEDGIVFYKSENDVILSPGNSMGVLPTKYFRGIVNL